MVTAVPQLTVGLPVHNGEDNLTESLEALLGQSNQEYELIISDNASTDGKWASADDVYARDLLKRCVAALDERFRSMLFVVDVLDDLDNVDSIVDGRERDLS